MKRSLISVAAMVLLVGAGVMLVGCEEEPPLPVDDVMPGDATVEMRDEMFEPSSVTISAGETVTWVNEDPVIHNVVGDNFSSGNIGEGGTFSHTFDEPGVYEYTCTIHPGMDGTVVVE